jgi:type I restriction enzyme R subunit
MTNPDAEAALEDATLDLFAQLGWATVNAYHERYAESGAGKGPYLGRATRQQVVLRPRLRVALKRLNPDLPPIALEQAIEQLTRDRGVLSLARANQEVYQLLKKGVRVTYRDAQGEEQLAKVRVINWKRPRNNDFLIAQQFWITGEVYTKRADLIGFVNGLPLLFGELKAHYRRVKAAYRHNFGEYKATIPQLFWYTGFVILSNGSDARIGTITADWDYFSQWKKINDEGEEGVISLETLLRGTCQRERFLNLVENYVLYQEVRGGLRKIVAMNHQYLGVENAIEAVRNIEENEGQLGVFWHTQGSGKSFSMVFFSQKVLRKVPGNWTFVVVTDRRGLDDQIYNNFARTGAVIEPEHRIRAQSGEHLKQLLREDHRYVFTLIQKFHTRDGGRYPTLSERDDIIVMTDEAHRSQYDVLAMNMHDALPNAAFIGFTATPLIAEEEKTREVFGEYVSVYDFEQSMKDQSTVPLYYENRIPELELDEELLSREIDRILEEAELDEAQEDKLARYFAREYHLITRDDRLETIAADIVEHFINRGYLGKGMVISIDRITTVKMYEKVQKHWQRKLEALRARLPTAGPEEREALEAKIAFMEGTDMAVVISMGQNEVQEFREHGLEIAPHRKRMQNEELDEKFKDPSDPFRLVFVCAMWRTGFDAPPCSTIYLDRPMRNHTLMQTIARANRVFGDKMNGLIVDYVGIFRNLQQALAIYGSGPGGEVEPGEEPVQSKDALVERLREALDKAEAFCAERGVDVDGLVESEGYERFSKMDDAVEQIIVNDDLKVEYLNLAANVDRLFKAILPDTKAGEFAPRRKVFHVLADKIRALQPEVDISGVTGQIEAVLDETIKAKDYVIREQKAPYDLSKVDFEVLQERFERGRKRTEAEKLRGAVHARLQRMVRLNPKRLDLLEEYRQMIEAYNAGSRNVEEFFEELIDLAQRLDEEAQRSVAENLSEEELTVFDYLTRPGPDLNEEEKEAVKEVARQLLDKLKEEYLVLDWRKRQKSRAAVRVLIADMIWQLPGVYSDETCEQKSEEIYHHVYDNYRGAEENIYTMAV